MAAQLPEGLQLIDRSDEIGTLIVTGPESRSLLAGLGEADLAVPWLSHQKATIAGCPARLIRMSFAGELGWDMSTLRHDGQVVGETTSGGYGHRMEASITLGMVWADLAAEGAQLSVEIFGQRCQAIVQADRPLWDAGNERLRV